MNLTPKAIELLEGGCFLVSDSDEHFLSSGIDSLMGLCSLASESKSIRVSPDEFVAIMTMIAEHLKSFRARLTHQPSCIV